VDTLTMLTPPLPQRSVLSPNTVFSAKATKKLRVTTIMAAEFTETYIARAKRARTTSVGKGAYQSRLRPNAHLSSSIAGFIVFAACHDLDVAVAVNVANRHRRD
jgi:hypothetical protein